MPLDAKKIKKNILRTRLLLYLYKELESSNVFNYEWLIIWAMANMGN